MKWPCVWTVLGARSLQVLVSFVIVTYSQVRKGYALCRTRDLPGAWKATWKPFSAPRVITHLTYCIQGGLCTAFIQTCPSVPCLEARAAKSTPLLRQCRLDRTLPWMDIYLTENRTGERGKGREHQTLISFGRVYSRGWAGLEALVSHRPLCHHSHAKIPSKDAVQLTGTDLPNQVL